MFNKTKTSRHNALPAPALERLEDRTLLSGNVVGLVTAGTLTLTGDGADNTFTVDQAGLSAQQFRLTPDATTQINNSGLGVPVIFNVVKKDVKMNLGAGNDTVVFDTVALPGNVTIKDPLGDTSVTFDASTVVGRVVVRNGAGDDTFSLINASRIDHNVSIVNGNGDSDTTLDNSIILWDLKVNSGAGDDQLDLLNVSLVNRYVLASFGKGDTSTLVDDSGITGRLSVKTGAGGTDDVDIHGGSILSRGLDVRSGGVLTFQADDTRFDDNVSVRSKGALTADLTGGSYFAFKVVLAGGSKATSYLTFDTVTLNGSLSIRTDGGDDTVAVDDSTFHGPTAISLGGGTDTLLLDHTGANPGPVTTFAGRFAFNAGSGDDLVTLGTPTEAGNQVVFNGKSLFKGGAGDDTHTLPENAIYNGPGKFVSF
ncbi:MAG: hypothetical protein NT031_13435 [Planctomycetota bacterium]|nr:hypothetical protein [Planctomycetota bacterium]